MRVAVRVFLLTLPLLLAACRGPERSVGAAGGPPPAEVPAVVAEVSPAESAPEVDTEETGKASAAIEGAGELEESAATEESIAAEEGAAEEGAAEEESQPAGAEGAEDDAVREAEAVAFGSPPFDAGPTQQRDGRDRARGPDGGQPLVADPAPALPQGPHGPHPRRRSLSS